MDSSKHVGHEFVDFLSFNLAVCESQSMTQIFRHRHYFSCRENQIDFDGSVVRMENVSQISFDLIARLLKKFVQVFGFVLDSLEFVGILIKIIVVNDAKNSELDAFVELDKTLFN